MTSVLMRNYLPDVAPASKGGMGITAMFSAAGKYDEHGLTYDLNGNIKTLKRKGRL